MAKIDTLFMTKTAEKPYPLGQFGAAHTYITHDCFLVAHGAFQQLNNLCLFGQRPTFEQRNDKQETRGSYCDTPCAEECDVITGQMFFRQLSRQNKTSSSKQPNSRDQWRS